MPQGLCRVQAQVETVTPENQGTAISEPWTRLLSARAAAEDVRSYCGWRFSFVRGDGERL